MAAPQSLVPGKTYALSFDLHLASYMFPKGHRIRLAVSNALWPVAWPSPYDMDTTVELGGNHASWIDLPRVPLEGTAAPPSLLSPPTQLETRTDIVAGNSAWPGSYTVLRNENGHTQVAWAGATDTNYPWGHFHHTEKLTYDIDEAHPADAVDFGDSVYVQAVGAHTLTWHGRLSIRSDASYFYYEYMRTLMRDGKVVIARTWKEKIPRDHQ
jgi:hypothetical protein